MLSILQESRKRGAQTAAAPFLSVRRGHSLAYVADSDLELLFRARLGRLLRAFRRETLNQRTGRPVTQAEAADTVKVDTETMGRWERGAPGMTPWALAHLADLYEMSPAERLLLFDPPELPPTSVRARLREQADAALDEALADPAPPRRRAGV